jgi:hypothetical protein
MIINLTNFCLKIFIVLSDGYQLYEFVQFNEKFYCFIWWLSIKQFYKYLKPANFCTRGFSAMGNTMAILFFSKNFCKN